MAEHDQNYTLGRGEIFFDRFKPGTRVGEGERYLGNTPTFSISVEATNLDHFSSDRGIKVKDASVTTQLNRTGSIVTDSISPDNQALFFFGDTSIFTTPGATAQAETLSGVKQDRFYQIGTSAQRPTGVRKLDNVVVTKTPATPAAVLGIDYALDLDRGRIEIIKGGNIIDGSNVGLVYDILPHSREQIRVGNTEIEGALRYVEHNGLGKDRDFYFPWVKVRPNGEYSLKTEEWQQIPLSLEILQLPGKLASYIDGQPYI